ncbi:hypothetical protein Tco_0412343 [Tanacetum coccineum]
MSSSNAKRYWRLDGKITSSKAFRFQQDYEHGGLVGVCSCCASGIYVCRGKRKGCRGLHVRCFREVRGKGGRRRQSGTTVAEKKPHLHPKEGSVGTPLSSHSAGSLPPAGVRVVGARNGSGNGRRGPRVYDCLRTQLYGGNHKPNQIMRNG